MRVRNEQGPLVMTNGPYLFRDGLWHPSEWRRKWFRGTTASREVSVIPPLTTLWYRSF